MQISGFFMIIDLIKKRLHRIHAQIAKWLLNTQTMVANFWRYFSLLLDKKGLIFGCIQLCSKFSISLLINLFYVLSGFLMLLKTRYEYKQSHFEQSCNLKFTF